MKAALWFIPQCGGVGFLHEPIFSPYTATPNKKGQYEKIKEEREVAGPETDKRPNGWPSPARRAPAESR
jgi:hypothetical protein